MLFKLKCFNLQHKQVKRCKLINWILVKKSTQVCHCGIAWWYSTSLRNRRLSVQILPGCKDFREKNVAMLLSNVSLPSNTVLVLLLKNKCIGCNTIVLNIIPPINYHYHNKAIYNIHFNELCSDKIFWLQGSVRLFPIFVFYLQEAAQQVHSRN
jgi:hypothetical protein